MVSFPIDDPQGVIYLFIYSDVTQGAFNNKKKKKSKLKLVKYGYNKFESRYASHLWEMTINDFLYYCEVYETHLNNQRFLLCSIWV